MAELLYINAGGTDLYGQSFFGQRITPDAEWTVESIWIDTMYVSVAGDAYCYIYADSGSGPTGSPIATSDANAVAGSPGGTETFTFSSPPTLSNGVPYWVVYHKAGAAIYGYRTTSNQYAGGNIGYTTHASDPSVGWQDNTGWDIRQFKVNGVTLPTSFTSVVSGGWDDPETWGYAASATEYYPAREGNTATITHTVTYSLSADVALGDVTIDGGGTLSFNPSANTLMTFGHDWLTINHLGNLSVGTSAAPIHKDYTAKLAWNCTADLGSGIDYNASSTVNIFGDSDYYGADEETFMANDCTNSVIITAVDDMSSKWNIGDEIVIHRNDGGWINYSTYLTLTTIVGLSGSLIECADSISSDYKSGGIIAHLTRNVIFYKVGYDGGLGQQNTNRPDFIGNNGQQSIANIYDASFGGFYRVIALAQWPGATKIRRSVFRNGYLAWQTCYYWDIDGGIQFQTAGGIYGLSMFITVRNNKHLGSTSQWIYFMVKGDVRDCYVVNAGSGVLFSHNNEFRNINFSGCDDTIREVSNNTWIDCNFFNNDYAQAQEIYDNEFRNCSWGYDQFGNERPNIGSDLNFIIHGSGRYINCTSPPGGWKYLNRNVSTYLGYHYFENMDGVIGDHRIYHAVGDVVKVDADGSGDNPTQRSGGGDTIYEVSTLSYCGFRNDVLANTGKIKVIDHQVWVEPATKTFTYYIQSDYTSLPSSDIHLIAEYMGSVDATVSETQSTESVTTRSNQSDWTQYVSVNLTAEQTGWVRLKLYVAAYESGKYIWIDPTLEVI